MKLLVFSFLFLYINFSFSQGKVEQSISSGAKTILIELESLNHLELKSGKNKVDIKVVCTNCDAVTSPKLSNKNEIVTIRVASDKSKIYGAQRNKFRAGQPDFPNYIIEVPEDKEVKIIYNKGNFLVKKFKGDLDVRLNHGRLNLHNIEGNISVRSFSGVIDCTLSEGRLKVENSKGETINNLTDSKLNFEENNLTGIYKNDQKSLIIRTIHAKVLLSPAITQ